MNKIIKLLSLQKEDKEKWIKYYHLETHVYYDYIVNIIPSNKNILEIGCGGGVFYNQYKNILSNLNNTYTCIDIDKGGIEYGAKNSDYVNFYVRDIHDFSKDELKKFDILLLVQSYIQIDNIEVIFKNYFESNPNGQIMMVNTIFPNTLNKMITIVKSKIFPIILNNDCVSGKSLTLQKIEELESFLNKKIINIKICKSLSGFDEYLTIIN